LGCSKKDDSDFKMDAAVEVESFKIQGQQAVIDQNVGIIEVDVPFGTDITSQKPEVALPANAAIFPSLDKAINFTGSVIYRITNGNVYKEYTVTVKIIPPLKSFSING